MRPAGASSDVRDLTVWNRAGLDRVRYTGAAAAEFTEALRLAHLLLWAEGQAPQDIAPIEDWEAAYRSGTLPNGTSLGEALRGLSSRFPRQTLDGQPPPGPSWQERLLAQYQAVLNDPSAQISRAFARALHVLSETLDAYANEGFLRTATQPAHLQHLLSLIGYRPRAAASATMPIAYLLKPEAARTDLAAGLGAEAALPAGRGLVRYEALETITGHPALNLLRAVGWDQSDAALPASQTAFALSDAAALSRAVEGTPALIVGATRHEAVRLIAADRGSRTVTLARTGAHRADGPMRLARLLSAPTLSAATRRSGPGWLNFAAAPPLSVGQVVKVGPSSQTLVDAKVTEIIGRDVKIRRLQSGDLPADIAVVFTTRAVPTFAKAKPSGGWEDGVHVSARSYQEDDEIGPPVRLDAGYVHAEGKAAAKFEPGQSVIVEDAAGDLHASRIAEVQTGEEGTRLRLEEPGFAPDRQRKVHGAFAVASGFVTEPRSRAALAEPDGSVSLLVGADMADLLVPGRALIVASDPQIAGPDAPQAVFLRIGEVLARSATQTRITTDQPASALAGLTRGGSVIYGNVALFGHGKTLGARVLGSGDAARIGQVMTISDRPVSTRPNPAFPGGFAADIDISVAGRIWQQISPEARPDEAVASYTTRTTVEGGLDIVFQSRLPTGTDNVRLERIRIGAGQIGNELAALTLTNLQPRCAAVAAVVQPISPQSGADLQDATQLRLSGGNHFALMGRALGPADFARLAEEHAGVWHAHGALVRQGSGRGGPMIRVTVVPAGGLEIEPIRADLVAMLQGRSQPGTAIAIDLFTPAWIGGTLRVRLRPGYADQPDLRAGLESRLMDRFGLKARPLGRRLYVSEIVAEIEAVEAVESVTANLGLVQGPATLRLDRSASGDVQAFRPDAVTAVYLASAAALPITLEPNPWQGTR